MKNLLAFLPALFILAALLIPGSPRPAQAAPLGLTETVTASYDATISDTSPDTNYGETIVNVVGEASRETEKTKSLLTFDLSGIPAGSTISAATLIITQVEENSDDDTTIMVMRVKRNWTESGVTWNQYDGVNAWQTVGADGQNDVDYLAIGEREFAPDEANGEKSFSLSTSALEDMISGTYQNYGFLLQTASTVDTMYLFASSEYESESARPTLEIEYEVPTVTPTPTVTVTPTVTPIPWNLPDEFLTNDLWTCPDPLSNLYIQGGYPFDCSENEITPGDGILTFSYSNVPPAYSGVPHTINFEGHYTGDHTVEFGCLNFITEEAYPIQVLQQGQSVDEVITADLPSVCYSDGAQAVLLYFLHTGEVGNPAHILSIDALRLMPDLSGEQTPTPTPAATPQPGEVTTTVTYGDIANFSALMLIAAVLGLGLLYNVVSSIVFRKRN